MYLLSKNDPPKIQTLLSNDPVSLVEYHNLYHISIETEISDLQQEMEQQANDLTDSIIELNMKNRSEYPIIPTDVTKLIEDTREGVAKLKPVVWEHLEAALEIDKCMNLRDSQNVSQTTRKRKKEKKEQQNVGDNQMLNDQYINIFN